MGLKRSFKRLKKGVKRLARNPLVQTLGPIAASIFLPGAGGLIAKGALGALGSKGKPLKGALSGAASHFIGGGGLGKGGGGGSFLSQMIPGGNNRITSGGNRMPGDFVGPPTPDRIGGGGPLSKIKNFFTTDEGKPAWGKIAGTSLGALGLLQSLKGRSKGDASPPTLPDHFNQPLPELDFQREQSGSSDYFTYGQTGGEHQFFSPNQIPEFNPEEFRATGGHHVRGAGSGRDDAINAQLSDNEYIIDAESVALLGDGSPDEGARRLDAMRRNLRQHKGQALAKGKFTPAAKTPEKYMAKGGKATTKGMKNLSRELRALLDLHTNYMEFPKPSSGENRLHRAVDLTSKQPLVEI